MYLLTSQNLCQLIACLVTTAWVVLFMLPVFVLMARLDRNRMHTLFLVMTESTAEQLQFGTTGLSFKVA